MKTPQEKYENDAMYRHLVQSIEAVLELAHFTPSEIREAAIFACTRYEMRKPAPKPRILKEDEILIRPY